LVPVAELPTRLLDQLKDTTRGAHFIMTNTLSVKKIDHLLELNVLIGTACVVGNVRILSFEIARYVSTLLEMSFERTIYVFWLYYVT